jgi:hypothetical protein
MNSSAIGQFDSTTKGFLFPRMTTTQRNAIASPATSLVIYNTTTGAFNYWDGDSWENFGGGGSGIQSVTGDWVDNTDPLNPFIMEQIVPAPNFASVLAVDDQDIYDDYFRIRNTSNAGFTKIGSGYIEITNGTSNLMTNTQYQIGGASKSMYLKNSGLFVEMNGTLLSTSFEFDNPTGTGTVRVKDPVNSTETVAFLSDISGSGTVTSITVSSPLTGGTITTTGSLGIQDSAADNTTKGAATFFPADFNTSAGAVSLDYTNGQSASTSTKGYLTSTDWNTFNNKQDAISGLDKIRLPIDSTGNTTLTGTVAETIVASLFVPANTFDAVCYVFITYNFMKNVSPLIPIRLYVNTSASLSGATPLGLYNTGSNRNVDFTRKFLLRGTTLDLLGPTTTLLTNVNNDNTFAVSNTVTIAPTSGLYFMISVQLDATSSVVTNKIALIEKQKL